MADGLPEPAWPLLEALRDEAKNFYFTDAAEARRIAERAIELAELIDEPRALGWALRTMAEALLYSGRNREADEYYNRATLAWRQNPEPGSLGQLLVGHIAVLPLLGQQDRIPAMAREARGYLALAEDDEYLAKLAINLGNAHFQRDAYSLALEEYEIALGISRRRQARDELVICVEINRAAVLTHLHRDQEGLTLYQQLEVETGELGFELLQAQIRMNAAHVQAQRSEFEDALRRLTQATGYFRKIHHPAFLAACLLNRAEIYHQLNLHANALELTEEAAGLFAEENLTYDEALALSQTALTHIALGQYNEALPRIERAATLFAEDKNAPRTAQMRLISGEALFLEERYAEATSHFEDALQTFRNLDLHRWEAAACVLGARILSRQQLDPTSQRTTHGSDSCFADNPIEQLHDCLDRLPREIYPLQRYRVLEALGEMMEITTPQKPGALTDVSLSSAESVFREAISCLEDIRVRVPTEDSKISFLQDKTHLYDRLLSYEIARPSPDPQHIFDWMERSRAQSLWDQLRSPRGDLETENPALGNDSEIEETRRHLSWLHSQLSHLELGTEEERKQAVSVREQIADTERHWQRMLRNRSEGAETSRAANSERVLTLPELQESLPVGWGWISYHLGQNFSLVLALTREHVQWCRLEDDLSGRVRNLCDRLDFQWGAAALSSVRSEATETTANPTTANHTEQILLKTTDGILAELYKLLWQPIEDLNLAHEANWIVSPHGPVHRVPLHALRDPSGYLVERINIALSPSARIWHELPRNGTNDALRTAWVSGVPSEQLPAVQDEVDRVVNHLKDLKVVKDLHPTRQSFIEDTPAADIIHLAAHGSLRKDNPAFSYVELTDGPLFVHDLASLQLRPSVVVLTACSSGRGTAPAGDEWIGLARGFLQAGATTVVASLWPIEDQPTLELMDHFYARVRQGDSVPVALGEAMRALRKARPHPWHWASFAVLGGIAAEVPHSHLRNVGSTP